MKMQHTEFIAILSQGILLSMILFSSVCSTPGTWINGKPGHHTTNGYRNYPVIQKTPSSLGCAFYYGRFRAAFKNHKIPADHVLPEKQAVAQYKKLKGNTLTWLGQSSFLIRLNNKVILTDPFFAKRASPLPLFGPVRLVKPGISLKHLPQVHIIMISHNHYDHLDAKAVDSMPGKKDIHVFVPSGLKKFFSERGYIHIHEMDWHESTSVYNLKMTALPMVHYSNRGIRDKNKSLWCSWVIKTSSGRYFFAGDTAYSPTIFKKIGMDMKSFDLSLIPIGTYGNRKYGINNHLNPEEAVKVGIELNSRVIVGSHWGTIDLSEEPPFEPPKLFKKAVRKAGLTDDRIWIMKIGETRVLPGS